MTKEPEKKVIITSYASAIALALQQIGSVPVTTTLIDTIPDDEWSDENAGEGNINAGKQAERPGLDK